MISEQRVHRSDETDDWPVLALYRPGIGNLSPFIVLFTSPVFGMIFYSDCDAFVVGSWRTFINVNDDVTWTILARGVQRE